MSNKAEATSSGIGFFGLLTIVFIVLKLTGVITWSWLWVLSPLFIVPVTAIFIIGIIYLGLILHDIYLRRRFKK